MERGLSSSVLALRGYRVGYKQGLFLAIQRIIMCRFSVGAALKEVGFMRLRATFVDTLVACIPPFALITFWFVGDTFWFVGGNAKDL